MLSQLAQGVGTWTGELISGNERVPSAFPHLEENTHRHGITVTPRTRLEHMDNNTAPEQDANKLVLPKTYVTRKGALVLFSSTEDLKLSSHQEAALKAKLLRKLQEQKNADPSHKFRTIERFTKSVLSFGDENYEKETVSISDQENPVFLRFMHSLDSKKLQDVKLQPGAEDVDYYVRDVKSRAASARVLSRHGNVKEGWISADADSLLNAYTRPASHTSIKQPSSRPNSASSQKSYKVLSTEKLAASIKSASYLGRPESALTPTTELEEFVDRPYSVASSHDHYGHSRHGSSRSKRSLTSFHSYSGIEENENAKWKVEGEQEDRTDVEDVPDAAGIVQPLQPQYQTSGLASRASGSLPEVSTDVHLDEGIADTETVSRATPHEVQSEEVPSRSKSRSSRHSSKNELVLDLDTLTKEPKEESPADGGEDDERRDSRMSSKHSRPVSEARLTSDSRPVSAHSVRSSISSVSQHGQELPTAKSPSTRDEARSRMSTHSVHSKRSSRRSSKGSIKSRSRSRTPSERADLRQDSRPESPTTEIEAQSELHDEKLVMSPTTSSKFNADELLNSRDEMRTSTPIQAAGLDDKFRPDSEASVKSHPAVREATPVMKELPTLKDRTTPSPASKPDTVSISKNEVGEGRTEQADREPEKLKDDENVKKLPEANLAEKAANDTESGPNKTDILEKMHQPKSKAKGRASSPSKQAEPKPKKSLSLNKPSKKPVKASDGAKKDYVKAMEIEAMETPAIKQEPVPEPVIRFEEKPASVIPPAPAKAAPMPTNEELQLLYSPPKSPTGKPKGKVKAKADTRKKEQEALKKLENEVTEILDTKDSARIAEEEGGLTVEEMELEQQILKEKLEKAEEKMKGEDKKKGKKEKQPKVKGKKAKPEPKRDLAEEREALKQARLAEKQKRLEEAKALENQIRAKEDEKKAAEEQAIKEHKALEEEMEAIRYEEEQALLAEQEARDALVDTRKAAREEREIRRKQDAERKKMEVQRKREEERKMKERARQKEKEMLERIADAEQRKLMAEEDALKREEEELAELERLEEEEKRAKIEAEEREEMERDMERQIEEDAMAKLVKEREEAEERRRRLENQKARIRQQEDLKKQAVYEEQMKLHEKLKLQAEEEERRRELERERLSQLQKLEEEARERMKEEMEKKREILLRRRDVNLERKSHLDGIKRNQGLTKPWVFSYYVHWPRETYQRPMGEDPKEKKRGFRPKPKPKSAAQNPS